MDRFVRTSLTAAISLAIACATASAASVFSTTLSGANANPPNASPGTGSVLLTLTGNTLDVSVTFSSLTSDDTAAHIHCCAPVGSTSGVALPFTGFPTGVTSGTYSSAFDLTNSAVYDSGFLTASGGTAADAEGALLTAMNDGTAYVNIHTTNFPDGELRGQLAAVPEPATFFLGGLALLGLASLRRKVARD